MKTLRAAVVGVVFVAGGLLLAGAIGSVSSLQVFSSTVSQTDLEEPNPPTVYRADLKPIDDSGVKGTVQMGVKENTLAVSVNANGVEESVVHAQHIHENAECSPPGAPIVSLDDDISNAPGDATNGGSDDSFPTATPGGTVNYRAQGSVSAIEGALGESLDLANRTVVVHAAGDPIGGPVACGELNKVGK